MVLTPLDIEKARFHNALGGYRRDEVEQFRLNVLRSVEEYIERIGELSGRIKELEGALKRYQESEELLKNSVVLAQRTCDELIAAAHKRADAIKQAAENEGDSLRHELADLRAQREQFEYAFHGLLTGFLNRLEQGNPRLTAAPSAQALPGAAEPATQPESPPRESSEGQPAAKEEAEIKSAPPPSSQVTPPAMPPIPPVPSVSAGFPTLGAKRDTDAGRFSATLDAAKVQPGAPRTPVESRADEEAAWPSEDATAEEKESSLFAAESSADEPPEDALPPV